MEDDAVGGNTRGAVDEPRMEVDEMICANSWMKKVIADTGMKDKWMGEAVR